MRVAAAVYAVVQQSSGQTQGLVAAKVRLAKQGLTIPRLELISGHMANNLIRNVRDALEGLPVTSLHCWLDSSVALHWIRGGGNYKQFVANRVQKIQAHPEVSWRHVGTAENPADFGRPRQPRRECEPQLTTLVGRTGVDGATRALATRHYH